MTRNILLPLLFLFGCGDTPVTGDDGGTDATVEDSSKPDTGSKDGSTADTGKDSTTGDGSMDADADVDANDGGIVIPDAGAPDSGKQCQNANDCKLFSSYCSTDPCKCFPLGKNDPNPQCMGMMVSCLQDPCNNKSAFCNNGTCDVQ